MWTDHRVPRGALSYGDDGYSNEDDGYTGAPKDHRMMRWLSGCRVVVLLEALGARRKWIERPEIKDAGMENYDVRGGVWKED